MTVRELIEKLSACNPDAEVVFHEYADIDDELVSFEFSPIRHIQPGYAMRDFVAGGDSEISVYVEPGTHSQGYLIDLPVVAFTAFPLKEVQTNATTKIFSGR